MTELAHAHGVAREHVGWCLTHNHSVVTICDAIGKPWLADKPLQHILNAYANEWLGMATEREAA